MSDYSPKPEHKFTFGLWTVGNRGADPCGSATREHKAAFESYVRKGETHGLFDLEAMYYRTDELWFPEWDLGGGPPWERPEEYARDSPHRSVARWKTPTLVTHGELDYRCTVDQGHAAFTALQRRGIESRLVVFPDENHWVLKPRNTRVFYEEVFGWIERHLDARKPAPTTP